jgi:hypothetical protein
VVIDCEFVRAQSPINPQSSNQSPHHQITNHQIRDRHHPDAAIALFVVAARP